MEGGVGSQEENGEEKRKACTGEPIGREGSDVRRKALEIRRKIGMK